MGLIRFLLALSVIIGHSAPFFGLQLVHSGVAVEGFFIISGFYMFLVLTEKYDHYLDFIATRSLRLFPVYFVVLGVTLITSLSMLAMGNQLVFPGLGFWVAYWNQMNPLSICYLLFTNLFILGQDWIYFLALDHGALRLTVNFNLENPNLSYFVLIPQAWSLGIELMFYLIVPFLVRVNWKLLALMVLASLAGRAMLWKMGLYFDPWDYRLMPTALGLFVVGGLSYRIHRRFAAPQLGPYALAVLVGYILVFSYMHLPLLLLRWVFFALLTVTLPFIFQWSKDFKMDQYIGELSYPLYIVHFFSLAPFPA